MMNIIWRRIQLPALVLRISKQDVKVKKLHSFVTPDRNTSSALQNFHNRTPYYSTIRWKSKKVQEDSDDEDENFDDDTTLKKDSKVVKFSATSLRTDLVLKSALGIARNKVEQYFYESKIRVNGKKILKKSASVRVGDEIDIVRTMSPKNPDHIHVYRVEILNVAVKDEAIMVTARRFKNLLIENYEKDPYKFSSAEIDATN